MDAVGRAELAGSRSHNSPRMLGLDAFLGQIPIFLFSLIGGVIADRMDRRRLLVGSQFIQMSCALALGALFAVGRVEVWHILALSFVVGLAQAFGGPAYQALVPTLVPQRELSNAIALNSIQFNLARVIGPMLGGIALTTIGAAGVSPPMDCPISHPSSRSCYCPDVRSPRPG